MATVLSLAEKLRNDIDYSPSDSKWFQFIQDHKDYIKEKSKLVFIDRNIMNSYKFRPFDLLSYLKIKYNLFWIILFINNIIEPTSFENITFMYIPDENILYNLRMNYNTFSKNLEA